MDATNSSPCAINAERRKYRIDLVTTLVLAGFLIWAIYLVVFRHDEITKYLGILKPFDDYTNNLRYAAHGDPYLGGSVFLAQFPFLFVLSQLLSQLGEPEFSFSFFIVVFIAFLAWYCYRHISCKAWLPDLRGVMILTFCSYPMVFAFERGNFEIIVFILVALFALLYRADHPWIAAPFLALAIALKPFPAGFLLIYLADRKFLQPMLVVLLAAVVTWLSYASFTSEIGVSFSRNLLGMNLYHDMYVLLNFGICCSHSLFGAIKSYFALTSPAQLIEITRQLLPPYKIFAASFGCVAAVVIILVEKTLWKRFALVVFCMNLLPYVSADYKLLHLYIPLLMFLQSEAKERHEIWYACMFVLLFIPKNYGFITMDPALDIASGSINAATFLNPALMLIFSIALLADCLAVRMSGAKASLPPSVEAAPL